MMRIDVEFEADQQEKLRQALGDDVEHGRIAQIVARAGARESLAQATGDAVFSSMADLNRFRIFCFLQEGMGMSEAEPLVASIFKVPSPTAKRLVNAAVARYKVELDARVRETVVELLDGAAWNEDQWDMRMPSVFVRERIADLLERLDFQTPTPAQRGSIWRFPDETYQALRQRFGLTERATSEHP
jgi:hypothetical protein